MMEDGQIFLLVEDDPDVLHFMERAMKAPGRAVVTSENAAGALAEFECANGDVAIVITDVVLPDMSGPAMIRRMLTARPDLKVLFTTGYSDETVATYMDGLQSALLRKPFTVAQLRSATASVLNGTTQASEAGAGLG